MDNGYLQRQIQYDNQCEPIRCSGGEKSECAICRCGCKHRVCDSCLEDAINDESVRIKYIYSSEDIKEDWFCWTENYLANSDTPTNEESVNRATIAYIREDIPHFRAWYAERW